MSSDIAVKIDGLSKSYHIFDKPRDRLLQMIFGSRKQYYKEFWALQTLSMEIRKGETIGLIGRNGSGKSTLLQLICGTLNATTGTITTHGRVAALLELGSGFNPEFTGRENVYLNAAMLGLTEDEITERFDDIAAFADIGDFIEQPVKTYSSGMYVRLAFAVVAHVSADILVIDEALAVGDAVFTQKCMRFLRRFQESGTILFVSHDIGAVTSLCQRAYWLDKGVLRMSGTPKDISAAYMADIYEAQQGPSATPLTKSAVPMDGPKQIVETPPPVFRDMRLDFLNQTPFRNDIQLFTFEEDAKAFGKGGASIENVQLRDSEGRPLQWVVGGERVSLHVSCRAHQDVFSPIVGFFIKDRLGQVLFGDNTYLTHMDAPLSVPAGASFSASFSFPIPILPIGDYSINVALAEGNQQDHIQHQWIHEALIFRSTSSSITTGLVGIPMESIKLTLSD
ncbi:ABC transporter ATP-binding protein [Achromobacter piechaudii]|uniref:ABC transporter, ATP-binding protein n=1 Tax=Achromobacter piechaudii ATCC 43553 TaxID=742159 RepID=D4X4Y5_9BURK|nr:ABC transporter ATP-binding protein [Achromobacter piechaudii]EFF78307.1 ABC transporter, ATP-binding protein [Achromobacter piechaudii ATCC 43553]